jgi:hypothetical protein
VVFLQLVLLGQADQPMAAEWRQDRLGEAGGGLASAAG